MGLSSASALTLRYRSDVHPANRAPETAAPCHVTPAKLPGPHFATFLALLTTDSHDGPRTRHGHNSPHPELASEHRRGPQRPPVRKLLATDVPQWPSSDTPRAPRAAPASPSPPRAPSPCPPDDKAAATAASRSSTRPPAGSGASSPARRPRPRAGSGPCTCSVAACLPPALLLPSSLTPRTSPEIEMRFRQEEPSRARQFRGLCSSNGRLA